MSLPSNQLDAFVAVAKTLSFSWAAKDLHLTQSALSQRILNLESQLGSTLFIREPSGIRLTELGQKLLRYCQMKDSLESEFLVEALGSKKNGLGGILRFAGFSSVTRSVALPSLQTLISEHPDLQIELLTREIQELPSLLETGSADFILLNRLHNKQGIENLLLGYEINVLVEAKKKVAPENVFLDHDSDDSTTEDFFKIQSKPPKKWRRSYFDEIYTIIDGVLAGAGRAVLPLHLVEGMKDLRVCRGFKPMKTPVYFCYYKQPYYTALQKEVIRLIQTNALKFLLQKSG